MRGDDGRPPAASRMLARRLPVTGSIGRWLRVLPRGCYGVVDGLGEPVSAEWLRRAPGRCLRMRRPSSPAPVRALWGSRRRALRGR